MFFQYEPQRFAQRLPVRQTPKGGGTGDQTKALTPGG
jgi:hypothetical protein